MAKDKKYMKRYKGKADTSSLNNGQNSETQITSADESYNHNLRFSIPGVTSIDVAVKYTGTEEEVKRADQITATLIDNILSGKRTTGTTFLDNPNMMPQTTQYKTWYNEQAKVLKDNGYPVSGDGLRRFLLDNSAALRFIRGAVRAADVIEKYGAKVDPKTKVPQRIQNARK